MTRPAPEAHREALEAGPSRSVPASPPPFLAYRPALGPIRPREAIQSTFGSRPVPSVGFGLGRNRELLTPICEHVPILDRYGRSILDRDVNVRRSRHMATFHTASAITRCVSTICALCNKEIDRL